MNEWTAESWGAWIKYDPVMLTAKNDGSWALDVGGVQVDEGKAPTLDWAMVNAFVACRNWGEGLREWAARMLG
jgi:hypothetical protein